MNITEIQHKTKYIKDFQGKILEVILPYDIYNRLLELQISMEIFNQRDVQQSIQTAKKEVNNGEILRFSNMNEAIRWLDK
ncbi:MAG: hypothetical protein DRH57_00470 [Candidatus Cloacimonadota bacterium]|nr:MAG: hypothetical protein DRH57_00470 [Candidatus Cloacimonadota bacterium]